jgi:hypothetical protein
MQQKLNIEDSNRSGRPHKVSGGDVQYLKMLSEKIPCAQAKITRDSDLNVSKDIVGRPLEKKATMYTSLVRSDF